MLQGVAYWMAYKDEVISFDLKEADIVSKATSILSARLSDYSVKREVDYSIIDHTFQKQKKYADLALFSRANGSCEFVIEFKLGDNYNGGYKEDIKKVNDIKRNKQNVTCLVVIAFRKNCTNKVLKYYVTKEGNAKNGVIKNIPGMPDIKVKVRRVCMATGTKNGKGKMKKVICLEVL